MTEQWRELLTSHIIPNIVPTGKIEDEQTLKTINPHAKIRINLYNTPAKVSNYNTVYVKSNAKLIHNLANHDLEPHAFHT